MQAERCSSGVSGNVGPTPAGGGPGGASGECWDSISYLEGAFHHGFMRSRLKTGEFVFQENTRLTRELDEFCDVDGMHQPKGPILLLGEGGVGKSAFLANWLVRRKKMFQNGQSTYPEFIFHHVVGCSRQSLFVSNLLERILREIKEYFELQKEIPDVEERLSWQFPRFVEAASKKGRIILIIDGLQRLRTSDGESILKWVPLVFPPNVRLVFSGTNNHPTSKFLQAGGNAVNASVIAASSLASSSLSPSLSPPRPGVQNLDQIERANVNAQMMERIKLEANRRNWTLLYFSPWMEEERLRVVKKFIHKHQPVRTNTAKPAPGTPGQPPAPVPTPTPGDRALLTAHGLQLFELQQRAIVSIGTTASPQFLKTFLTALAWAVNEGVNIHVVFEQWLSAESSSQLIEAILRTMETGHIPNEALTEDAKQFLQENRIGPRVDSPHSSSTRRNTSAITVLTAKRQQFVSNATADELSLLRGAPSAAPLMSPHRQRSQLQLGFGEIDEGIPTIPGLPHRNSVHETAEVILRMAPTRQEVAKSVIPPMLTASSSSGSSDASSMQAAALAATTGTGNTSIRLPPSDKTLSSSLSARPVTSRRTLEATPLYLTGGTLVPSLNNLVGPALALLYVSRHGLLQNELKYILNAVIQEANQAEEISQPLLHRKATFSHVKHHLASASTMDAPQPTSFSEIEWRALLRALKPVGVLFVQSVIVLPICEEALRDVVWWRYIGSERAEQKYHQWLIRFFRIHPTTFRRVEELPWHLKRCYQWDALRNVLVNLANFQLLYTVNSKNELFGYWKLLTDGPLPLYTHASAEENNVSPNSEPSLSSKSQTMANNSHSLLTSDALVYATPFDVVKEYGRSLEDWYKSTRPTTKAFTAILQLVTKFMHEFCMYYQGYLPNFTHAPFGLRRLHQDGLTFAEDLPHVQQLTASSSAMTAAAAASGALLNSSGASPMALSAAATAANVLGSALDAFLTLNQQSATNVVQKDKESNGNWFYFYQRWIWIQFPWLALGKEIVIREPVVEGIIVGSGKNVNSGGGALSVSVGNLLSPSSEPPSHFGSVKSQDGNDHPDEETMRDGGVLSGAGTTGNPGLNGTLGTAASSSHHRSIQLDSRFWDVKPSLMDATQQKQKGSLSPTKVRGLQNSSVLPRHVTTTLQTESLISPDNLFRKKSTYAAVKNVLSSSMRALPGTSSSMTTLPAIPERPSSGASVTFLTEAGVPAFANGDTEPDGSKSGPLSTFTKDTSLVLDNLTGPDSVTSLTTAFGLPAHFQDYPQSEWGLRQSYNRELVLKLQTLYDSARLEAKKKQSQLQHLKHKIRETQGRYELAMRDCEMAKHAMEEMQNRMNKIENMLQQIDRQGKGHRKLLRSCEMFPASDPSHFETLKKELKLLQMKHKDLTEERKVLLTKRTHLKTVELPILQREVERNKLLLSAVVEKLEKAREKMAQDQAATDKLYHRRLELIDAVRKISPKDVKIHGDDDDEPEIGGGASNVGSGSISTPEPSSVAQLERNTSTRSIAARMALQQCESMCEKIQKATGYSKLDLILEKFVSREELNRSFEEQAKVYEARLKQIKLHQTELEQQLHALEMSNAVTNTDDPRMLEEKLRVAEVELARTERTQNALLTMSKEVIAGASRVVKLLGITSCRTPHQSALPAAQLWPPPVDKASTFTSEFETLEAKEIATLLQICQERAMTMVDVVEGGRADPDAGFSMTKERSKNRRRTDESTAKAAGSKAKRVVPTKKRGSVTIVTVGDVAGSLDLLSPSMHDPPATPELDDDDKGVDVVTREAIKATSKSKIAQKKRVKDQHATVNGNDVEHD
ncbi:hypothetical protein Poli38472_005850 [Pythium oligandrum]|uniref:NACHT domain-containing protein n=1 Tax=Pythium oligandrum TaxID=41045 RepID=A0A8K1CTA8_PYTOL|nr:hypothetical protein Poli38472_005850 [Pythium oligandrum]|eukprot:TMW68382.1 hypothetical protein Poli38472_005850 [Pythium oligandrum]